ncbi:MAG: hypothetical protein ACKOJD_09575, partial [Candidatus Limnocylindrus sp.]
KGSRCPACTKGRLLLIVYGLPFLETFEAYKRGEISLGGCVIREVFDEERGEFTSVDPQLSCPTCGAEFFRDGRRGAAESI